MRRRLLARDIDTPLASNVAVTSFADVPQGARPRCRADVLSDPHYWGGMRQVQYLVASVPGARDGAVDAFEQSPRRQPDGDDARRGRLPESHLCLRHALPVAIRSRMKSWPEAAYRFENGAVKIPDKPGLGVELDYDQLARGRERYDEDPVPKTRRRSGDAQARRSELAPRAAPLVRR